MLKLSQTVLDMMAGPHLSVSVVHPDPGDWAGCGCAWSWAAEGYWLLIAVTNLMHSGVQEEAGHRSISAI